MKLVKFIWVKLSSYDSEHVFKEWFEIQPQYDNKEICINMENINESNR